MWCTVKATRAFWLSKCFYVSHMLITRVNVSGAAHSSFFKTFPVNISVTVQLRVVVLMYLNLKKALLKCGVSD